MNLGIYKGAATLLRDESPWLTAAHCFNHRIEGVGEGTRKKNTQAN